MTWSAEELFVRAYAAGAVAAQGVWDLVKGVERITKPTRRTGFDEDAAGEFLSKRGAGPLCCCDTGPEFICAPCGYDDHGECIRADDLLADDTPNPCEPGLDDAELIGVRGLLQERYNGPLHERAKLCLCPSCRTAKTSAPVKSTPGTGAGSTSPAASTAGDPSSTIASAAPRCAVDGEGSSADSGIPQPPAGERPTSELLTEAAFALASARAPNANWIRTTVALTTELRDRAATFTDIEQSK